MHLYSDISDVTFISLIWGGNTYAFPLVHMTIPTSSIALNDYVTFSNPNNISIKNVAIVSKNNGVSHGPIVGTKLFSPSGNYYIIRDTEYSYKLCDKNDTAIVTGSFSGSNNYGYIFLPPIFLGTDGDYICSYDGQASGLASGSYFTSYNIIGDFAEITFTASNYTLPIGQLNYGTNSQNVLSAYQDAIAPSDPYSGAGDSDTGGGDGTFDGSSDPVPIPSLPTVGATDAGFITLYAPTTAQLKNLAYTCWVGLLDDVWTNFRKLFTDPMDCILGLSVVPVAVPTSGAQDVAIGNIPTGVTMNVASQQYIELNCGTVSFANKFFGSYLDYEPYTKMSIFVPYSGVHAVNADDIMGKTVQLVYHIDILTGSLVAFLKCGDSVLYEFNGACASNIPVNSLNYASTIENAVRIAVNIGTTVATAGASAPALAAGEATAKDIAKTAGSVVNTTGATAEGAISMKPGIDRAGSLGGTTGLMGNQIPYFIITRPRLCKPKNQDFYKGYPSFIQTTLGDLDGKGYTEFDTVILAGLYLTDTEKSELLNILAGGVYL